MKKAPPFASDAVKSSPLRTTMASCSGRGPPNVPLSRHRARGQSRSARQVTRRVGIAEGGEIAAPLAAGPMQRERCKFARRGMWEENDMRDFTPRRLLSSSERDFVSPSGLRPGCLLIAAFGGLRDAAAPLNERELLPSLAIRIARRACRSRLWVAPFFWGKHSRRLSSQPVAVQPLLQVLLQNQRFTTEFDDCEIALPDCFVERRPATARTFHRLRDRMHERC
jgi:hypothetical protein